MASETQHDPGVTEQLVHYHCHTTYLLPEVRHGFSLCKADEYHVLTGSPYFPE